MKKSTLAGCNGRGATPPHQISLKSITNVSPSFLGMCSVYSFQSYQYRSIWNCKPAMIKNHTSFIHVFLSSSSKEFNFWHWNSSLVSSFWKSRFQSSLKQVFNERHFHLGVDQIHISIGILCCQVGEPCYRLWLQLLTLSYNSCFHQERKYLQKYTKMFTVDICK